MNIPCDWIFLAGDEWGSDLMRLVAERHFAETPDLEFIEVHEHAGWWLCYHRSGGIVGTANDAARWPAELREIRERAFHRTFRREIRRQATPHELAAA